MSFITLKEKSFGQKKFWNWCTGAKVPKWLFRKKIATLPFWHFCPLCIDFKNFFGQMTTCWVLWKICFKFLLKKCLRPCPGLSMSLSRMINWIILGFPPRISEILFVLGRWDDSWSLGFKIIMDPLICYDTIWK